MDAADRIEAAIGRRPVRLAPLSGGCIAEIYRADFADGERLVAKLAGDGGDLALEAYMLDYLRANSALPVPAVIHGAADLLVMEYIETAGSLTANAECHAAELLAALHGVSALKFGHEHDTLIGPLNQPNLQCPSWRDFFCDQRLLAMARVALEAGRLPGATMARIETLAGRLDEWIDEPAVPSLIHGDMWGGNVLTKDGRIAGFVDPAIYYADAEIELAFATLFSTFGKPFFQRYGEIRPLKPGFFEVRRELYNLYPLLVHVRLFGGGYLGGIEATLRKLGC
ncbi:MAG TPA: fructosamine kinase family protein [Alphaproteobacteria bacterium]|nr:fructosamine kinase family protein [Alphaproteobacteria bacterium]